MSTNPNQPAHRENPLVELGKLIADNSQYGGLVYEIRLCTNKANKEPQKQTD